MFRPRLVLSAAACLVVAISGGCGSARMVQSTPDGGIVAIPSNSNYWPVRYRDDADKLMAQRCPNGYDIVKEEEVVIGKKKTTSNSFEREPLGILERSTSKTTTTMSDETEYRITFRARQAQPSTVMQTSMTTPAAPPPPPPPPAPAPASPGLPPRPVPAGL